MRATCRATWLRRCCRCLPAGRASCPSTYRRRAQQRWQIWRCMDLLLAGARFAAVGLHAAQGCEVPDHAT